MNRLYYHMGMAIYEISIETFSANNPFNGMKEKCYTSLLLIPLKPEGVLSLSC